MTSSRTARALVTLFLFFAASCGGSESSTETAGVLDEQRPATTSSIAVGVDAAPGAPDVDTAPAAPSADSLESNPNDPSTPMGALCWTRWEISRLQLQTVLHADERSDEPPEISRDAFAQVANDEATRLAADRSAILPESVRSFADGLFAEINQRAGGPGTSSPIDFEKLPEAAAYIEAAAEAPGCKQP